MARLKAAASLEGDAGGGGGVKISCDCRNPAYPSDPRACASVTKAHGAMPGGRTGAHPSASTPIEIVRSRGRGQQQG